MHSSGSAFSMFASSMASASEEGLLVTRPFNTSHLVLEAMMMEACREETNVFQCSENFTAADKSRQTGCKTAHIVDYKKATASSVRMEMPL